MLETIPFEDALFEILLLASIIVSIIAIHMKDLLYAVIMLAIVDLSLAALFFMLAAPDIAITQIAVTAALATFIFMIAIHKTERKEQP
ncbi:MAG: hydrogenase subunit MbhD domain-containing protein [archaeon]